MNNSVILSLLSCLFTMREIKLTAKLGDTINKRLSSFLIPIMFFSEVSKTTVRSHNLLEGLTELTESCYTYGYCIQPPISLFQILLRRPTL